MLPPQQKIKLTEPKNVKALTGLGVSGSLNGKKVLIGNPELFAKRKIDAIEYQKDVDNLSKKGKTVVLVAVDGKPHGLIGIADTVKKEAKQAVQDLQNMGVEVLMLTGDNEEVAQTTAKKIGIKNVLSNVLPKQKAAKVKELQASGKKVAMVGDGINDAPALAQADIGLAIGTGTDVAIEAADISLISGDISAIPSALRLSKKTMRIIYGNLFWAFGYNIILIPIAAGALYPFTGILLSPIFAAGAMSFSSVFVVLNSLRLKRVAL